MMKVEQPEDTQVLREPSPRSTNGSHTSNRPGEAQDQQLEEFISSRSQISFLEKRTIIISEHEGREHTHTNAHVHAHTRAGESEIPVLAVFSITCTRKCQNAEKKKKQKPNSAPRWKPSHDYSHIYLFFHFFKSTMIILSP